MNLKRDFPIWLVYSRLPLGFIFLTCALFEVSINRAWYVVIIVVALITDIFDGILARKWNTSSERLRKLDSNIDTIFWLLVTASIAVLEWAFFKDNWLAIMLVIFFDALTYVASFIRFKKGIATHSILAKFWTITLLAFYIELILTGQSVWLFWTCIIMGIISRWEILAIILTLKFWTSDVPSIFVVKRINRGETIKKNPLFNS